MLNLLRKLFGIDKPTPAPKQTAPPASQQGTSAPKPLKAAEAPKPTSQQSASPKASSDDFITMTDDQLGGMWSSRCVYKVPKRPDPAAFLDQASLPYLLPDNNDYIESKDSKPDKNASLRCEWSIVFLRHPDRCVVRDALSARLSYNTIGVQAELARLVASNDEEVGLAVAKAIWREKMKTEFVMNYLGNRGFMPAGVTNSQKRQACLRLSSTCPVDRQEELQTAIRETLGNEYATALPVSAPPPSSSAPKFKERLNLPGAMGGSDEYVVYDGESKEQAKAFLATQQVTKQQHYIIVETPQGVFGKDCMGTYEPSKNWRG